MALNPKRTVSFLRWTKDLPVLAARENRRVPLSFDLELTARCNCDCRHCSVAVPASDRAAKARELTLPDIERIADEAVALGALWCLFTGGEPLLREDFADAYLALKRKGLLVSVFTNATLVTEAQVDLFQKYPPRDIEVTVYGVTQATYERVTRRPGSWAAFQRGLGLLLDGGIKVRLKAMALRSNVHELPEIARFCRERTKDFFRFDPLLTLRLDRDEVRNRDIRAEWLSAAEIVELERADRERFESLRKGCAQLIMPERAHNQCDHLFHCGAGQRNFSVSHDGLFRLCSALCHPDCVYDLGKGSLQDAWRNFVPKVRDMRSTRREFLQTCRVCPVVNLCLWCPAHADLETSSMDGSVPYFCEVAHARAAAMEAARNGHRDACAGEQSSDAGLRRRS
jgi:radical SAM protein with 4Fe4S-binding SPASM domain